MRAVPACPAYKMPRRPPLLCFDGWKFLDPSHQGARDFGLFKAGSFGVEVHPDVAPQPGDIVAQEHWTASGFADTDLDYQLRQRGIDRVVIAGNRAPFRHGVHPVGRS